AVRFGILFKNIGIGRTRGAEMTVNMLRLAGALSLIRGTDPSQTVNNLSLALAGNVRGLKQMGIVADSATIKRTALRLGLIKEHQTLTPATKAMAIYSIATQNLGLREQQASAHSGDLAVQQAKLHAQWVNTKTTLGKFALPALSALNRGLLGIFADLQQI